MNWEAIGAIGETLGAAGVILTLAYLAIQIKQNTRATRSSIRFNITQHNNERGLFSSEELAGITDKLLNNEPLQNKEFYRLHQSIYGDFQHWQSLYYQYKDKLITKDEWMAQEEFFKIRFGALEVYRDYWHIEGKYYSAEFQQRVENILTEIEAIDESEIAANTEAGNAYVSKYTQGSKDIN